MSRSRRLLLAAPLALIPAACGDDAGPGAAPTTTASEPSTSAPPAAGGEVPPSSFNALIEIFQPALDDLDLTLARAAVSEFEAGPHLALYVVPNGPEGGAQGFLDRTVPLVAALEPLLFERFPGLRTFDVCQEPFQAVRSDDFPLPETLLVMNEEQLDSVPDWSSATLVDLMRAVRVGDGGEFRVTSEIERLPEWRDAEQEI